MKTHAELDAITTPEQIQEEVKKAGKTLIRNIDGSQQKAFMAYARLIAKESEASNMSDTLLAVWGRFKSTEFYGVGQGQGLGLFLNIDMEIIDRNA